MKCFASEWADRNAEAARGTDGAFTQRRKSKKRKGV